MNGPKVSIVGLVPATSTSLVGPVLTISRFLPQTITEEPFLTFPNFERVKVKTMKD